MKHGMNLEEIRSVIELLYSDIEKSIHLMGYETVSNSKNLFRKITGKDCKFIHVKRYNNFSDWINIRVLFGFNHKELFEGFDSLKDGKKYFLTNPLYQKSLGDLVAFKNYDEQKKSRAKYNCFHIGEWEIRNRKELYKADRIKEAIFNYEPKFGENRYDINFFKDYPEQSLGHNHKDFIKLQIIAARLLSDQDRENYLINYYRKRKNCDIVWLDKFFSYEFDY